MKYLIFKDPNTHHFIPIVFPDTVGMAPMAHFMMNQEFLIPHSAGMFFKHPKEGWKLKPQKGIAAVSHYRQQPGDQHLLKLFMEHGLTGNTLLYFLQHPTQTVPTDEALTALRYIVGKSANMRKPHLLPVVFPLSVDYKAVGNALHHEQNPIRSAGTLGKRLFRGWEVITRKADGTEIQGHHPEDQLTMKLFLGHGLTAGILAFYLRKKMEPPPPNPPKLQGV